MCKQEMENSRILGIRQQPYPNEDCLDEPFEELWNDDNNDSYREDFLRQIPGQPIENFNIKNFPDCITHYYWVYDQFKGVTERSDYEEKDWKALFMFYDEEKGVQKYGYYESYCDTSGFGCQGDMRLYISDNYDVLVQFAMPDNAYELYITDTFSPADFPKNVKKQDPSVFAKEMNDSLTKGTTKGFDFSSFIYNNVSGLSLKNE